MLIFVGGRDIEKDKVFVLRAFPREQAVDAAKMYGGLLALYGKHPEAVELLHALAKSPESFFESEPTWSAQFPDKGDRTFGTAPPEDKRFRGYSGI